MHRRRDAPFAFVPSLFIVCVCVCIGGTASGAYYQREMLNFGIGSRAQVTAGTHPDPARHAQVLRDCAACDAPSQAQRRCRV